MKWGLCMKLTRDRTNFKIPKEIANSTQSQRYTYRVLQTIQMKLILLWVWAEQAVMGRAKTALKFKYEI